MRSLFSSTADLEHPSLMQNINTKLYLAVG